MNSVGWCRQDGKGKTRTGDELGGSRGHSGGGQRERAVTVHATTQPKFCGCS